MIYAPLAPGQRPYTARIWRCTDYAAHWHSNTEIYICLQGRLKLVVEGVNYALEKDDVLLVAGNEHHQIFCDREDSLAVILAFGYGLLGKDYDRLQDLTFPRPLFRLGDTGIAAALEFPLTCLRARLLQSDPEPSLQDWLLRSDFYALAAALAQEGQAKPLSKDRQTRAKQLENLREVLEFVHSNYQHPITLDQAAAITGYDKSYFCKQFRSAAGMTFHRYLNCYRIGIACRLLDEPGNSMAAVAEQAGFTSQKMLSRLFREILGITPTQYRALPPEKKASILPL